jgi:hypothetical protein
LVAPRDGWDMDADGALEPVLGVGVEGAAGAGVEGAGVAGADEDGAGALTAGEEVLAAGAAATVAGVDAGADL